MASNGEITPPCGVPRGTFLGGRPAPSGNSHSGALSHMRISLSTEPSAIRFSTHAIRRSCGMLSKYPFRSAS